LIGVFIFSIGVEQPSSLASAISSVSYCFLLNCLFVFRGEKFFLFFFSVAAAAGAGTGFFVGL